MRGRRRTSGRKAALLAAVLPPCQLATARGASAHAFGARYDLPLPLDIYLVGAGLVVLLSFVVAAVFLRPGASPVRPAELDIPLPPSVARTLAPVLRRLGMIVGLLIFSLVLATAFFGSESPTRNFAPTFVWVIWWVGMVYVAALGANLWPWLNPWRTIALAVDRLASARRARPREAQVLAYWPAVLLFVSFAWIELVFEAGEDPETLGLLICAYTALVVAGALLFGGEKWLVHGEVFGVVFGVFGRFAPLRIEHNGLRFRLFASGLLVRQKVPVGLMIFVILMVSTVTFDGFVETPAWSAILDWIVVDQTVRPALLMLREAGVDLLIAIKTCALILSPLIFLAAYLPCCRLVGKMAGSPMSMAEIACSFVFSLVPIAIAYHLAHYYSFLLLAGQLIIPLLSDPFGFGWDLFGTAGRALDTTVVNAKTTWYVAIVAIILGHVIAVILGHLTALRLFLTHRQALLSQIPMTVLMIAYTMVSLWILSQPIVESPTL